tara:strand:+ start:566 stop:1045 length:480 start_codon:yes stop_codon:yes gene_type:complete
MSFSWYSGQGPNFVPAYQVSGIPYVTSSEGTRCNSTTEYPTRIEFPYVTKSIAIKNTGNRSLRVSFTKSGSYKAGERDPDDGGTARPSTYKSNFFLIPPCTGGPSDADAPPTVFDVRCKEIFLRSNNGTDRAPFSLYAALTGVEQFPVITGSNGFKGVG